MLTPPNNSFKVELPNRVLESLRRMRRLSQLCFLFRSLSAPNSPGRLPRSNDLSDRIFDVCPSFHVPECSLPLPRSLQDLLADLTQPPAVRDPSFYSRTIDMEERVTPKVPSPMMDASSGSASPLTRNNYRNHLSSSSLESMSSALDGKHTLLMSCDHICHSKCAAVSSEHSFCTDMIDPDIANILSISSDCGTEAMNKTVITYASAIGSPPVTSKDEISHPIGENHVPAPTVESRVMWPRVSTLYTTSGSEYVFYIQAPLTNAVDNTLPSDAGAITTVVRKAVECWLTRVAETWTQFFPIRYPHGDLLMLDSLKVTTNGIDWDMLTVYCFENALVLTTTDNDLVGQIWIQDDISSINTLPNSTVLNLMLEGIPEIQLKQLPLVMSRWNELLRRLKRSEKTSTNVYQLTTTAWKFIESLVKLPEDVVSYASDISTNQEQALSINLARAMLAPQARSLNLILLLSVVNTLPILDDHYRRKLAGIISDSLEVLRPQDKLSLVLVGIDGEGRVGRTGRFVGCIGSEWDGWQNVIDDIEVIPNDCCLEYSEIFPSDWHELCTSIEKCLSLVPFLPCEPNTFNKLVVATVAGKGTHSCGREIDACSQRLTQCVPKLSERLSISIMRVGRECQTDGSSHVARELSFAGSKGDITRRSINTLVVETFATMDSLRSHIHECILHRWQRVIIPKLLLELDIPQPHVAMLKDHGLASPQTASELICSRTQFVIQDMADTHSSRFKLQINRDAAINSSFCLKWSSNTTPLTPFLKA